MFAPLLFLGRNVLLSRRSVGETVMENTLTPNKKVSSWKTIVSYKAGTEQNINLVLSTIKEAKKKEKVTAELQLHSDQEFQYTSQAYFNLTQYCGITPSMSRRGNSYDNALAENMMPDHVHLLVRIPPINRVSSFMGNLKGKSAMMIFERHTKRVASYSTIGAWTKW